MSNPGAGPDGAPPLTIGAVAKMTGKSASAIRYYEQIGLLPEPARAAGRRRYDQATVRTLAVIETAQRAGLALDEIKVLLSASPGDPAAVERLREVASRKLPEITALIERSELVRGWLECAAQCECPDLDECPLFDEPALPPREMSWASDGDEAVLHADLADGSAEVTWTENGTRRSAPLAALP